MRIATALLVLASLAPMASAQPLHAHGGALCTLYEVDGVARPGPALPTDTGGAARRGGAVQVVTTTGARGATFEVRYVGFTAEAQAAFQRAVDIWGDHLASDVTVRVDASFEPLGRRALGQAGARLFRDFPGASVPSTWYPFALADAAAGYDLFPKETADDPNTPGVDESFYADIEAQFNSQFADWYYGLNGNPPSDKFDFVTVVLHELGHGLGFAGSATYDNGAGDPECGGTAGRGCWGYFGGAFSGYPIIFDRFAEDANGVALLDGQVYPNNSQPLGGLVQSENLFIDAPTVRQVYGGERPPVWAPATFEPGSSYSHWDEILFSEGTPSALMTPSIRPGESYTDPGSLTCAFFQDMGWTLAPGCTALFGTPAEGGPEVAAGTLRLTGPNPFHAETSFRLALDRDQRVEVHLFDVLGRHLRTLYSGPAAAGALDVRLDGAALPPGAYVVRARAGGAAVARSVIRAR